LSLWLLLASSSSFSVQNSRALLQSEGALE
jgi:hypothetical protein